MRIELRDSKLMQLVQRRNGLTVLLACSVLLNALQGVSVIALMRQTRVVIVPPEVQQPFWVGSNAVSETYLQQMTDYFLTLILNVTPETSAVKRELLLGFVHTASYGVVKAHLVQDETEIKKRNLARFFAPRAYEISTHDLSVKTIGDLTTLVGQEKVGIERIQCHIRYQLEQGRLWIDEFSMEKING